MSNSLPKKSEYITKKLDEFFGLRAWGLILYGALPSNLALLGVLEVKIGVIQGIVPLFFIIIASILPIFLIFLLIRDRHKKWYLTRNFLNIRSAITTIMILILATLIAGMSGLIHNRYTIGIPQSWNWSEWSAITESFLLAVASLVVSTTFFITALTEKTDLPGLPSSEFVKTIAKVRINMKKIKNGDFWNNSSRLDIKEQIKLAKEIKQYLDEINLMENYIIKESSMQTYEDIIYLIKVLEEIRDDSNDESVQLTWNRYFGTNLPPDQITRRSLNKEKFDSVRRLKTLNLG